VLGLLAIVALLVSTYCQECNTCNPNGVACVSNTEFKICSSNLPVGDTYPCPNFYKCTGGNVVCEAASIGACSDCELCNANKTIACLSATVFAVCISDVPDNTITGDCAPNYVCNRDNPKICGKASEGFPATCATATTTATTTTTSTTRTTTAAPNPADGGCGLIQKEGAFPRGNDPKTTCRQLTNITLYSILKTNDYFCRYIVCSQRNNVWYGDIFYCPGNTYFDSTSSRCVQDVPATCSSRILNLAIRGRILP
ncbi:CG13309, partial [Drosophila busckii]